MNFALSFSCKEQRAASSDLHASSCNLPLVTDVSETACQGQGAALWKNPSARSSQGASELREGWGLFLTRAERQNCAGFHGASVSPGRLPPPLPSVWPGRGHLWPAGCVRYIWNQICHITLFFFFNSGLTIVSLYILSLKDQDRCTPSLPLR